MSLRATIAADRGSFEVRATIAAEEGETLALLGPNGSGKTTVVSALAGLIESVGTIELAGERIDDLPPERRPLGVAFQDGALFPHLPVLANVAFPLRARGVRKRDAHETARATLSLLAPDVRPDALPPTLSGGEAQRVALARAIVHHPRLLLLDEPSSGLDVRGRAELRPVLVETLVVFPRRPRARDPRSGRSDDPRRSRGDPRRRARHPGRDVRRGAPHPAEPVRRGAGRGQPVRGTARAHRGRRGATRHRRGPRRGRLAGGSLLAGRSTA